MHVTKLLEDKCLQQINLCYRPDAKMAEINNIEIFGSVCRGTNPPAISIKRGKDKQAFLGIFQLKLLTLYHQYKSRRKRYGWQVVWYLSCQMSNLHLG
jgi:hypothetical protein